MLDGRGALADRRTLVPGELTIAEQIERCGRAGAAARALRGAPGVPRAVARPSARSRICSAVSSMRARSTSCSPSTATRTCGWSTTASSTGARRRSPRCRTCAATTSCRRERRRWRPSRFTAARAGTSASETFAVGDSREDLACAAEVDAFWLVANAVARDPSIREALAAHANARVCEAGHGAGVYEAVVSTLIGSA